MMTSNIEISKYRYVDRKEVGKMFYYGQDFLPNWLIGLIILWVLPWKGVALWKSARNGQKTWFIVLLLVNTLAILEILYLKFWQKKTINEKSID